MNIELSIIMPCLNEEETLAICIKKAQGFITRNNVSAEIIIADNGSTDSSIEIAKHLKTKVIHVEEKGYGSAITAGLNAAEGIYCIIGDADDSYNFAQLDNFLEELRNGTDLVMGNRFKGGIEKGAMPFLHRYLGNPGLSFVGRLFFKNNIGDFHCGLRGISKSGFQQLDLVTTGMEFASEMVVKSVVNNFKIAEVPTTLSKDGRSRKPHLRTWQDGWRHLRFLLMYSPKWLFFIPGLVSIVTGLILSIILIIKPLTINNITFDVHTLLYANALIIIGIQCLFFYVFSNNYAVIHQLLPENLAYTKSKKYFSLEKGILLGGILILFGIITSILSMNYWANNNFGALEPSITLRWVIPAATTIITGFQTILFSFITSIIEINLPRQQSQ